jgi:hypothetical protein
LEDGKPERSNDEGRAAASKFGEGSPEGGACGEAKDVQAETKEADFRRNVELTSYGEGGDREDAAAEGGDEGGETEYDGCI